MFGEDSSLVGQSTDDTTLRNGALFVGETRAVIECFLCGRELPVKLAKTGKPYFICDPCGVQAFVRRQEGIARLVEKVRPREPVPDKSGE